jgi:putative addiction module component (TIGR02574 family)
MSADLTSVFDAALRLSDNDRANLTFQLLQTLKPTSIFEEDDERLELELQRRLRAYESGHSTATDWDAVSLRMRDAIEEKRSS